MGTFSINLGMLSALLVLSVLWKPAYSEDKCSIGCVGSPSGPAFLNGHKYNYGVEGVVTVYLTGAEKQETNVKLLGQVSVSALGNCAYILKVQNLVISGPDGKKYNKPSGIDKPVRFTLQDGRIGSDICAEEGDTRRSLNIKRAIISLLQTEQASSTQIDVFGACPTEISSSQEGGAILVHRTRDLSRCAHREQSKNDLLTAVYNPTAEIKSTEVLQSSLNVETKVNNGVPEKVAATEEYLYVPFSVGQNGARAKVQTKLTLTGKSGGADSAHCIVPRTIIFENPHGVKLEQDNFQSALAAVRDTAKTCGSEASSRSAGAFAQLIRILRNTNKDALIKVYGQVKGNSLEKRVFLDGLLRAGTGYSIEASIQILKSKELSPIEQELVYLSLGNARHVNNEAIKASVSLLDQPNIPKELYLGVGALAGAYCREHNCHGTKPDGIVALSQKLAAKLQNCKPKSKIEEDNIVAVLKSIRNIRHLEDNIIDKIAHCAVDNSVKARVRAAALEAFQADPCTAKLKKTALDILKNRQQDSEIRIKAYLAVIACPCGRSANEIKKLLDTEPVHQVGRFITTSLRHIRTSTNPDKQLARQHYGQIRTPNKFNVDDRKYSHYSEASYNVDALGVGGNVEQTVIYSQDSFIPRSVSVNVTAEVFGHNLNILEVGGRQGNLDRVIEHFLGPKGILRTQKPQEIYDTIIQSYREAEQKVEHGIRGRRSVTSEIDGFDKRLKAEAAPFNNELDLDIYVKLFGTDAVFLSLGDDKGFNFNNVLDQVLKVVSDGFNKAKHFQQEIRAHLLFLDAELAYPTSTGLPLKLDLVGSATTRLDVSTNIDIRQCLRSPQTAKVDFKVIPSTDIEISGSFVVDADAVATGLKVITNLHSSTGIHVVAKVLENGRGIDLQLGLPVDKQEIVTASNELVHVIVEKGQVEKQVALKVDTDRKEYSGCFDQLSGVLGLTLCGEVSVPFAVSGNDVEESISKFIARYPLTGPSRVKLVLEKNDLRGYHIKGIVRNDRDGLGFELLFDAEGSHNRRTQLVGEYVNNPEEKSVKLSLESPIKVISGQVALYTKPSEYVALVKAKLDSTEYYGKVGFNIQGDHRRSVFKPIAEYQLPDDRGKQILKINGQLVREINGQSVKYTVDGVKIQLPNSNEIIDVNGHCSLDQHNADLELRAKKGEHSLSLIGSVKDIHSNQRDIKLEFQNTLNPNINFKVTRLIEYGEAVRNDLEIVYGPDLRSLKNRVVLNQLFKEYRNGIEVSIITKNKFEICSLPLIVKLNSELDSKKINIEFEGQYLDKRADLTVETRTQIKKPGDYYAKVIANYDKQGIEVLSKRDIVSEDKSNLENYIVVKNHGKYELSGVVLHRNRPNDVNVGAIGHLKISGGRANEDIKFDIGVIENANLYSSHAKISGQKGDILDYLLKIVRGPNSSGQLKLILKDTIAANGQFKLAQNDGKGNGVIIVDFKKAERKIKAESKFILKESVYNADIDVYLNFEKDNADKVHFSTNNRIDKVVDSKNKLVYDGKKTEVNVREDTSVAGKTQAYIEVILPTERQLSLKVDRQLNEQEGNLNGNAEITLTDAVKRGGPASTICYKSKLVNTNFDKDTINYEAQIDLTLKDGRQLQNSIVLNYAPIKEDKAKFYFKTEVNGNLIPKPACLTASADFSDLESIDGIADYRLKGNYGDDINFELVGNEELRIIAEGDKKYREDYTLTLRLPFEKAHDIKIISSTLYLEPDNADVIVEYTLIESVQINADLYKVDASGKIGVKNGFSKAKLLLPHVDPISADITYKANLEGPTKSVSGNIRAQYGKGKKLTADVSAVSGPQDYDLKIKASLPQGEIKSVEIGAHVKNPSPDTYISNLLVDVNRKVYKSDATVVYSKVNPVLDLTYSDSETPKPSRIYIKGTGLSSNQGKAEIKIDNIRDICLDAVTETIIQKDNILIKVSANSDKLDLKNYELEISTKDAGSGKKLELRIVNNNKNILSGSTSFVGKQEGTKTIYEGSGSVKIQEEHKSANFKYIRTLLTEGNEQGIETFLNLALGERSYVAESRVTNLEYKNSYVYCEEKKQCAHAELLSKINIQKPGVIQHLLNVGLDLRKLGFAPEFGLQVNNEISENDLPQYSLDLHVNKEDKKYHLHVYSQPARGKFPAGITVNLPHRVLALESLITYPSGKELPFPIKGELALHLDKNKPQHKTAARFLVDLQLSEQQSIGNLEIGFSHPKLGKEAVVKAGGEFKSWDSNKCFKIETHASICHPALGKDRDGKILLEVTPGNLKLIVNTYLTKVLYVEGSTTLKDNLQEGELKFSVLESKPVLIGGVIKDFQYYEFTTGYSDESQRKLSIVAHLEPEDRVDISADIVLPGQKKNIAYGALFLKDNLVKSDYGVSKENFNYFVNALQKDLNTLETRIKQLADKISQDFKNTLKRVEPTLKQLEQAYKEELDKLYQEIANDKTLQEISQVLGEIYKVIANIITEVVEVLKPIVDNISNVVTETANKVHNLYEKEIEPQVKQLYENIATLVKEYFDGLIDLLAHFAAIITDFFEKHKAELEELTNVISEIFKDLTRLIVSNLKEIRAKINQIVEEIITSIKEAPILESIKEKWKELNLSQQVLGILHEIHGNIRQVLPNEEIRNLEECIYNYIVEKLTKPKVDDVAHLRAIYQKIVPVITSTLRYVRVQLSQLGLPLIDINTLVTGPEDLSLPTLGAPPAFSFLNELIKGDLPDPLAIIKAYRPRSLNPLDEVPAKLRAVVVNGQHIFTFDGRHLTFPGNCRYVLAHDHVDRNFTLAIQLQNGQPKSLILEDKSGIVVELKESGQVALNGAVHGYPIIEKDVFAFKQANGRVGLGSLYGLMAFCTSKLEVCYIEVSGFYLGKLRGLLGDGNNEPFDDFRLPNGKICTSEGEFGNAYRLAASCPQVKCPEHSHHQHHAALPEACEKVFGSNSPLRPLALLLDVAPFRQACIHAVAGDSGNALRQACDLGRGYAALAVTGLLPAVLPDVCVQCNDADKPRKVGETYELKLPTKQADIVVAVEVTKPNQKVYEQLVIPLVGQVLDTLKSKQITDIKVYLVGITSKYPYPIIYDTDPKLKTPKVKFTDESRYSKTPIIETGVGSIDVKEQEVARFVDKLKIALGLTNVMAGYRSILDLPLRAGAVKHTINVVGEQCTKIDGVLEFIRAAVYSEVLEQIAYTHSLVSLATEAETNLKCAGSQDIVGFTKQAAFKCGDKKITPEAQQLRSELSVNPDACIDFIEETNGLILSASNYLSMDAGRRQQFLQTASAVIVQEALRDSLVQECTCSFVDPFRVRSVCINKERKAAAAAARRK